MSKPRVLVLHGWNSKAETFRPYVHDTLVGAGFEPYYVDYDSTNDEARLTDFTESLFKELQEEHNSRNLLKSQLHFLTHSTGALVFRQWLAKNVLKKIGNVVMLAPANFGSPLAPKGRKWYFRLTKAMSGFEVGTNILNDLELASEVQWQIAEHDLFNKCNPFYSENHARVSVITGAKGYGNIRRLVNQDGTDGTIVVAGANLNARYLRIDYRSEGRTSSGPKVEWMQSSVDPPFALHTFHDHSSIYDFSQDKVVCDQVVKALSGSISYAKLREEFGMFTELQRKEGHVKGFKQLVCRLVDQHRVPTSGAEIYLDVWRKSSVRDGVPKERATMDRKEQRKSARLRTLLNKNRHIHSTAKHMQRYLLSIPELRSIVEDDYVIALGLTVESGDKKITYNADKEPGQLVYDPDGMGLQATDLLEPDTTTLIDIRVDRNNKLVTVT